MNLQQIFNNAWNGAKSKGFSLSMNYNTCQYRDKNGNCCAIGWSIPDDKYDPSMEGSGIQDNQKVKHLLAYRGSIHHLVSLQECHDKPALQLEYAKVEQNYERNLRQFAEDHDLKIPGE